MKRKIQSYLVFTSGLSRLGLFVLLPLLLLGLQIWIKPNDIFLVMMIFAVIILLAEVVLDYWNFGGVVAKNNGQFEYLKSSKLGMEIMQNALIVSMIRQFLESAFLLALGSAILLAQGGDASYSVSPVLLGWNILFLEYFIVVSSVTIARFFDGLIASVGTSYIAVFFMLGGIMLVALNPYVMLAVLIVLSMAVSVGSVKLTMHRVKESYYDKTA